MNRRHLLSSAFIAAAAAHTVKPVEAAPVRRIREIVANDGTHLFYRDLGSGPQTLAFTSSWALDSRMWDYQVAHFARLGFRCIAWDRRGHGRSDVAATGCDMDTLADDLAGVARIPIWMVRLGSRSEKPTQDLGWYESYNAVKHDRENSFGRASLKHAFEAVSGVCRHDGRPVWHRGCVGNQYGNQVILSSLSRRCLATAGYLYPSLCGRRWTRLVSGANSWHVERSVIAAGDPFRGSSVRARATTRMINELGADWRAAAIKDAGLVSSCGDSVFVRIASA